MSKEENRKAKHESHFSLYNLKVLGMFALNHLAYQEIQPASVPTACPLSTSPTSPTSPPPHLAELNALRIYFIFIIHPTEKEASQIPVTYNMLPAEPLIDFFDRNVLIRSLQMAWKDARRGEGKRESKGGKRQEKVCSLFDTCTLLSTWRFQSTVQSTAHACILHSAIYEYNAQLIKEKE